MDLSQMMIASKMWNESFPLWFRKYANTIFSILPNKFRKGFVLILSMMKQSLELNNQWKLWLEFQLWTAPIMIDNLKPESPVFYLVQALLNIFSSEFAESSAFLYCWFSCFHSLCYLGKTTVWEKRQMLHITSIIKKKRKGRKYERMRAVPLSSLCIIKIPVDPATLDAWEELLISVSNHL